MEQNMMDTIARISGVNPRKCMRCGKCTASCPAFDEMEYHPHQFVSMVENGRIDELLASRGIYTCLSCFACVERCPRNVEPAKLIEAVQPDVLVKGGDWSVDRIVGRESVQRRGGEVISLPLLQGYSTTALIEKIRRTAPGSR